MLRRLATDYLELVAEAGETSVCDNTRTAPGRRCVPPISDVFQRSGVLLSRFLASESPTWIWIR